MDSINPTEIPDETERSANTRTTHTLALFQIAKPNKSIDTLLQSSPQSELVTEQETLLNFTSEKMLLFQISFHREGMVYYLISDIQLLNRFLYVNPNVRPPFSRKRVW